MLFNCIFPWVYQKAKQYGDGYLSSCHFQRSWKFQRWENGDHFSIEKKSMPSKGWQSEFDWCFPRHKRDAASSRIIWLYLLWAQIQMFPRAICWRPEMLTGAYVADNRQDAGLLSGASPWAWCYGGCRSPHPSLAEGHMLPPGSVERILDSCF